MVRPLVKLDDILLVSALADNVGYHGAHSENSPLENGAIIEG